MNYELRFGRREAAAILIFIIDRLLKFSVQHFWWTGDFVFGNVFIGLSYHQRFSSLVMVIVIVIVWLLLMWVTIQAFRDDRSSSPALLLISLGAASNLWDVLFGRAIINVITLTTVTGSLSFNLADLMIVGGVIFIFYRSNLKRVD